MLWPSKGEIGGVFLEKKIFKIHQLNVFLLFRNNMYIPLEKGVALHLRKLEIPTIQGCFVQSLVELVQWFWRRGEEDFNFINAFSLFCNYFPLEKGVALYFNKFENVQSFQTDGRTDRQ